MTIVGNGPFPVGGSVTSTSSGTPSKDAIRAGSDEVGQKRTLFCAVHVWPNGAGAASAGAATAHAVAIVVTNAAAPGRSLRQVMFGPLSFSCGACCRHRAARPLD